MSELNYDITNVENGAHIKHWTHGVAFEEDARQQLMNIARLPFVHHHIAAMPDVHLGMGATIGSVIPTLGAIIPAAVGVDIGCGMIAVRTGLDAAQLPDNLAPLRARIEKAVPHGRTPRGRDKGSWYEPPSEVDSAWTRLEQGFQQITERHPAIKNSNHRVHLSTLGTGNHFIEICLDEADRVWVMLHSGSRGVGNKIGSYFIQLAKKDMEKWFINLPDKNLAYFPEGTDHFNDYVYAVGWAQDFARTNRQLMMQRVIAAMQETIPLEFNCDELAVNCHHNYVQRETHYGQHVWLTRKGAVSAQAGELGIIPGSMGACSYIVRGLGNAESFNSCSHGAGRAMSRTAAKKRFSVEDHAKATEGVECRKDAAVVDETPDAYKPIDAVMDAQKDLVEVVHRLKQVVCVKG